MSSHLLNSKNRGTLLWCKTMVRYWNCFLSSVASDCQDGRGLNLGKVWPTFSSFNALPAKVMKKISLFDIFITLQDIYVWANALSNDLSIELTWNSDILVTWALFLNLLLMFWAVIRMFNRSWYRRLVWKPVKHQSWKQWSCSLCWKLPDRAQSFVFCSQIVTE